jgi:hypothetical protein
VSTDAAREEAGQRWASVDTIGGVLAMISIFASTLGLVWRPLRLIPFAVILAFVAARMTDKHQRLVAVAVAAAVVCWTVGMTLAILTENPLY